VQFGAPVSLSVKYSSGKTETRGYALSGQTIVDHLKALSPAGTQNYPWASGGPLTGQRETLGLANNVVPNPLNVANDWKTYVTGFGGIAGNVYLSAYFNGTGTLSLYKVVYDKAGKVFWLNPVNLGNGVETTKNSLKIPFADLTKNIYTQTGSLERYTAMNGTLLQKYPTFTPNDAWGQITRSLVAGFDAGLWGGSANSINPKVSGRIDLNQSWNWSAPYTYQAITAPAGSNGFGYTNSIGLGTGTVGDPNRKMYYDPFAAEFVKNSNAYGYSYSDLLSEGGGVNPSISLYDPGTNRNVSSIGVKLFDLGEKPTGYTKPGFNYVPPTGTTYRAANTKSTDQFLFDFSLGKYFPAAGVPITFRFYAPGDAQAKNGFVSFSLPTGTSKDSDYEQSFTVGGSAGHWTLTPNGFSGKRGYLMMSGVPVTSDGSTGWYQMVIGTGNFAKTYNIYVKSSASSPTSRITSAVVDGGALAEQIPNQANQVKFSFDPSGNITYSPYFFAAPKTMVGSSSANLLTGSDTTDYVYGEDGNDTLSGGGAGDQANQLWGGAGNDTATYAGTLGVVYADLGARAGYVDGFLTDQMDSIENLVGGSDTNTLIGDDGANRLTGGAGIDYLYGQGGNDTLTGGAVPAGSTNQLWGGAGNDTASYAGTTGAVHADLRSLAGYVDGVLVDQMNSIENLHGSSNADTLVGDGGANVLYGGGGADALWGEGGSDSFVYAAYADSNLVSGYDTIADFVSGSSRLDLTAFDTDAAHVVIQSESQSTALYVQANAGSFNAATDLAISFVGANAIAVTDIRF
jgi:Ca2+-binding RTX toxin-like protein